MIKGGGGGGGGCDGPCHAQSQHWIGTIVFRRRNFRFQEKSKNITLHKELQTAIFATEGSTNENERA